MSSSQTSEQFEPNGKFEYLSHVQLLNRGLHFAREGHHAEGVVYFTLAREKLDGELVLLAGLLESLTQGHIAYWKAQQELLEASKRFVQVEAEQ